MPRVRAFRLAKTINFRKQKPKQLRRLLLKDLLRLTTSKLPESALEDVFTYSARANNRHQNLLKFRARNLIKSPNDGQTIAVKDNFVTRELPTTCASHILEGFSAEDATVVKLLKDAGMSIVAKTNMDEFGMGSHSTNSAYGAVRQGFNQLALSAGGSSGGSAMAVASGLVDCALGSDTGGSVRLPAAYTGIVGFKPSYGMISRHGLIPYANSLDTVGLLAKTAQDIWLLYSFIAEHDPKDPTSLSPETRRRISRTRNDRVKRKSALRFVSGVTWPGQEREFDGVSREWITSNRQRRATRRIGVPQEYNIAEMHPDVRSTWIRTLSNLQYQGHQIVPISLPSTQQALSAYYVIAPAEASSNLAKYDGVRYGKPRPADSVDNANGTLYSEYRGALFGDEVKRRILLGSFTLSAGAMDNYFIQAQKVRRIVQSDFDAIFRMTNPLRSDAVYNPSGIDYIVCPTAPTPPPKLKELKDADPLDSYVNDVFTVPASLAGLPAISVPAFKDWQNTGGNERSIGMQVIGQFGDDLGVIHFARRWLHEDVEHHEPKFKFGYKMPMR